MVYGEELEGGWGGSIPLKAKKELLDGLMGTLNSLRNLEFALVLLPDDPSGESLESLNRKIAVIREQIKMYRLAVPCESRECLDGNKDVLIYKSICHVCSMTEPPKRKSDARKSNAKIPSDKGLTGVEESLDTTRNLKLRVGYLIERISLSLAEGETDRELNSMIEEARKLIEFLGQADPTAKGIRLREDRPTNSYGYQPSQRKEASYVD